MVKIPNVLVMTTMSSARAVLAPTACKRAVEETVDD